MGDKLKKVAVRALKRFGLKIVRIPKQGSLNGKRVINFLHIGKNAGTQISMLSKAINKANPHISILKCSHRTFLRDLPSEQEYFFSIREPVSRFKSAFYSRKRKGQPRFFAEWTPYEAQAFADFEHANDLAEALFEEGERGRQAIDAINSISHTSMNQVDWFYMHGNMFKVRPPLYIIRQENFADDFAKFKELLGVDNETTIETDSVRSHRNDYDSVPELSERAVGNLKKWYSQDIEFYKRCEAWLEQ